MDRCTAECPITMRIINSAQVQPVLLADARHKQCYTVQSVPTRSKMKTQQRFYDKQFIYAQSRPTYLQPLASFSLYKLLKRHCQLKTSRGQLCLETNQIFLQSARNTVTTSVYINSV